MKGEDLSKDKETKVTIHNALVKKLTSFTMEKINL